MLNTLSILAQGILWTGALGTDAFEERNWDLTLSAVAAIDPNVSIDDDVRVGPGSTVEMPDVLGGTQARFQLADGRSLELDGARWVALGNDGVGGPNGAFLGVPVTLRNGASFEPFFVVNGVRLSVDGTSRAVFGGGGNPLNASTVDLAFGAELRFLDETPSAFLQEHLSKVTVAGAPAAIGVNLAVASDGAAGSIVTALTPAGLDTDGDLLSDADERTVYGTDPLRADTDGDGVPDGLEVARGFDPNDPQSRLARPNVVFVLTDDLGYGDLGVLFQNSVPGTKRLDTPNLDRMAAEGALLTRHYCPASVCAPSRASLLLGVHQGHAGVRNNQFDKALEENHNLANTLQRAGYATALIGKWGLQGSGSSAATWPAYPTRRGFDTFYGYVRHTDGHNHYPFHQTAARGPKEVWDDGAEVSSGLALCYTTDLFTARAKRHIVQHRAAQPQQPFFLFLAYDTPHAALDLPPQAYPAGAGLTGGVAWLGTPGNMINSAGGTLDGWVHPDYAGQPWTDGEKRFATSVRRLDDALGDLLQTLRDLGIDDETLVVLSSDNGPHSESYLPGVPYAPNAFDSFGPLDGIKRDLWEGGLRVPTLAWWPGTIPAGTVDARPSQFHDWLATFVELSGWPAPARTDGVPLTPRWTGGAARASVVYAEYESASNTPNYSEFHPSHRNRLRGEQQVVWLEGYKGIRVGIQSHAAPFEIFDVTADLRETQNLAGTSPYFVGLGQRMKDAVLRMRRVEPSAPRPYDGELVPAVQVANRPGVEVRGFEGLWPWVPDTRGLAPVFEAVTAGLDVDAHLTRPSDAALEYSGLLDVPTAGEYTFSVECDTGAVLWLHQAIAVDDDAPHTGAPASGTLRLAAGLHPFRLVYRTAGGATPRLRLRWSGPGLPAADIPTSALRRVERSIGGSICPGAPNSTGAGAQLELLGFPVLVLGDVRLRASGLPAGSFGFFLAARQSGSAPAPGGSQGTLCLGGPIGRFVGPGRVQGADAFGTFSLRVDPTLLPTPTGFVAGATGEAWYFQAWYRDANPGPTSNFSEAIVVTWL